MENSLSIFIASKALSVNGAWQGRRFKTPQYKRYEKEMLFVLPNKKMIEGWVEVWYEFGFSKKSFSLSDVGNFEKCLSDILVKKRYIEDDRKIIQIHLKKVLGEDYYIKIDIKPYDRE